MTLPDSETTTSTERHALRVGPPSAPRTVRVRVERARADSSEERSSRSPFVVLVHGFKGFMDWGFFPALSTAFARAGFTAVSMNASGSGVGEDPLVMDDEEAFFRDTYTKQLEDIATVRTFAADLPGVDRDGELLFGHSRGGGMAIISAAESSPRAVATWAAIDDADRFDDDTKRAWRRDGVLEVPNGRTGQIHRMAIEALEDYEENAARLDILAAAGRLVRTPLLAVHGTSDATVEPDAAKRIAHATPRGTPFLIQGADHGFGASHPLPAPIAEIEHLARATERTLEFAREHVR